MTTDATQDNTIKPPTCTQIIQRTISCNVVGFEDPATGKIAVGLQFVLPPLTPNGRAYFEALGAYLRILAQAIVTGNVTIPIPPDAQRAIDDARRRSQLKLELPDTPTPDEQAGMDWWNALSESERAARLTPLCDSAAAAWAFHKATMAERDTRALWEEFANLPDNGPIDAQCPSTFATGMPAPMNKHRYDVGPFERCTLSADGHAHVYGVGSQRCQCGKFERNSPPVGGIMEHGKALCHKCDTWYQWQTHHVCNPKMEVLRCELLAGHEARMQEHEARVGDYVYRWMGETLARGE